MNAPPPQAERRPRRSRASHLVLTALAAAVLTIAGIAVVNAVVERNGSQAAPATAELFADRHILFRSLEPGADFSRLGYADISGDPASRETVGTRCLRVAAGDAGAVCLRQSTNPAQPFELARLDQRLRPTSDETLNGTPSRTRVSPDGRTYASTVFVSGHNYISLGFSTQTMLYRSQGPPIGDLEDFTFTLNGERDDSPDRNVWGVTFTDDPERFYATVAANGRTYLAEGHIGSRRLVALQDNAECPSISPDGDTIVYKKRVDPSQENTWRFHALDLRTGRETPLVETRSIDDQVAWLDDDHVMYAVPKDGKVPGAADIWTAPIDGGQPELLIPDADSPTVTGGSL